jgi:hypothetical protein
VPKQYQGNLPNCIIALELAQRIGASPLMVMQNLYIVHGRPSWSSQFLIAAVNQCGRFTALQYEWSGKPNTDEWTCRAWAKDKATGERVQGPAVSIAMAKKEGWYARRTARSGRPARADADVPRRRRSSRAPTRPSSRWASPRRKRLPKALRDKVKKAYDAKWGGA